MSTPFDKLAGAIYRRDYHNHRLEDHSDEVSDGILADLLEVCGPLRADFEAGLVNAWKNVPSPSDRERKIDLLIAEPLPNGGPDLSRTRVGIENKSVATAHRNKTNRYDDLIKLLGAYQSSRPETVLVATVIVGTAMRYLNIPDGVRKHYDGDFESDVRPRLSTGDETLWTQFRTSVSHNKAYQPAQTAAFFRETIPTRPPGMTHLPGYDFVLIVPMHIDNVAPPFVDRDFEAGLDHDGEYARMVTSICRAYIARWHT
jgi:hypothetical protein